MHSLHGLGSGAAALALSQGQGARLCPGSSLQSGGAGGGRGGSHCWVTPERDVGTDVLGAGGRFAKSGLGSLVKASAGRSLLVSLLSSFALRSKRLTFLQEMVRGAQPRKQVAWKRRFVKREKS